MLDEIKRDVQSVMPSSRRIKRILSEGDTEGSYKHANEANSRR